MAPAPPPAAPDAGPSAEDALVEEQFRAVVADLPKLYMTAIVVSVAEAMVLWPYVPQTQLAAWLVAMVLASGARWRHWARLDHAPEATSVAFKREKLEQVGTVGQAMLAVFVSVAYFVALTSDPTIQTLVLLTLWGRGVGAAFFLFTLPRTSQRLLFGTCVIIVGMLLYLGRREFIITAPIFVIGALAQSAVLRRNFETFRAAIAARVTISRLEREATALAMTDALTGLANRRAFDERLAMLCAETKPFAVALIDLDAFKPVNDRFGHMIGDRALEQVAARLRGFAPHAYAARVGGDEFALLIEEAETAHLLVQNVADRLAEPYLIEGETIRMGASCGVSLRFDAATPAQLVAQADAALYKAKSRVGRTATLRAAIAVAA